MKLNTSKCEIIVFKKSYTRAIGESSDIGEGSFPARSEAACLGYQWRQDIICNTGSHPESQKGLLSVWQDLCLSGQAESSIIMETCVLPFLLYCVENWVLSPESIRILQGEIAKMILELPKWYSNMAVSVTLGWNSLYSVCTMEFKVLAQS